MRIQTIVPALAVVALFSLTACSTTPDGTRGNPPGTEASRSLDRAAGTNVSGAYPGQSDGTPGNPPGTAVSRTFDRAAGTDVSGAYPSQADGTAANPSGTSASRAANRVRSRSARGY